MSRVPYILALLLLLAASSSSEQNHLQRGLELYSEGEYAAARKQFEEAVKADPDNLLATYNLLTSLAAGGRLGEMENRLTVDFEMLGAKKQIRAGSSYNLGTSLLNLADEADKSGNLMAREKELHKSFEWLKQSLLDKPDDPDAKSNLEYANRLLEKLEKQKQQQQQNDKQQNKDQQNKDQQNQDQQQQDQQQDQQQQDQNRRNSDQQQNRDQDQQQNQQPQDRQKDQQQRREQKDISEDVARNLLNAAKEAELRALKMLREQKNKRLKKGRKGKDW